jgi:OmpA-OmpF porin, OOP family
MHRSPTLNLVLSGIVIGLLITGCSARRQPVAMAQFTVTQADFREALTVVESRSSDRGLILTMPDALFEREQAALKVTAQHDLTLIASYLKQHPDQRVLIEGYTDSTGTEAHNRDLSLRRGTAVETVFLRNGVDPHRLRVHGLGEEHPIASNATAAGREKNRRVEIVLLNRNAAETAQTDRQFE